VINCVGGVWEFEDPARYENRLNGLFFHRIFEVEMGGLRNSVPLACLLAANYTA
jgi:hypothetical protein